MKERISYQEVSGKLLEGMFTSEAYLKKSNIDSKLLELVKYRVSQINCCAFCLDMHHKEAIHLGETLLRLHSLAAWKEAPYYDEKERAVLAFTETLTLASFRDVDDQIFDDVSAYFSKSEIGDLTLAINQINSWNRINKVFRITPGNYTVGQY